MNIGQLFVLFGVKVQAQQFKAAKDALTQLKVAIGAVQAARLGHALVDMAKEAAHAGTHILGTAASLGLSTKSMQEWMYIAEQAGSNANQFATGLSMLERNLREFARGGGSKRFKAAMHDVHLSQEQVKTALNKTDGVNQAIFTLSDAYVKLGNNANRSGINQGLFGARSREMVQDLGRGSGVLKEQIKHLHDIGGIVSEADLKRLKLVDNAFKDLKVSWNGLFMTIVAELAPMFVKAIGQITDFVRENREAIREVLHVGFAAIGVVVRAILAVMELFAAALQGNRAAMVVVTALVALLIFSLVPALYAVAVAAWAAMSPIAIWPLIAAAIVAGIVLIASYWDDIAEAAGKAWDAVAGLWHRMMARLRKDWANLGHDVTETARKWGRFFADIGETIANAAVGLWRAFKANVIDPVVNAVGKAVDYMIGRAERLLEIWHDIKAALGFGNDAKRSGAPKADDDVVKDQMRDFRTGKFTFGRGGALPITSDTVSANLPAGASPLAMSEPGRDRTASNVSVGPTTININGVKDAVEARENIADSIDNMHRHAIAALNSEVV